MCARGALGLLLRTAKKCLSGGGLPTVQYRQRYGVANSLRVLNARLNSDIVALAGDAARGVWGEQVL